MFERLEAGASTSCVPTMSPREMDEAHDLGDWRSIENRPALSGGIRPGRSASQPWLAGKESA